ncbi:mechanosensitive ion channel family protein [Cesiribacter sp. SM1]|uniref:mechanosensitive ion channel family protein n=1 Tax=Cesiribacter sp. SM1 TaxID=2861196 RepID=UPI001CD39D24|nr:mechanosensitive ion channel domain-containing protein [Cesiribacter sp. SM1]
MNNIWIEIKQWFKDAYDLLSTPFGNIGSTEISITFLLYLIISILLVMFIAKKAKQILVTRILSRTKMDAGVTQSIGTIVRYVIIVLGLVIIFQSAGLDLSALSVLAGALGVGIGFGLQNIFNNFVSGLIILFERPIKVGDRVQVEDISGDVVRIAARATTIITNDNISIIIPNSEFVSSRVINWSHNDRMVRFRIPVGVAYKEDPEQIRKLLLEVAANNQNVLKSPAADVIFTEFGESSLNFELWVWTIKLINRPSVLQSQLYYAIFKKFKDHNIEIPFPQRDLHIKNNLPL